MLSPDRLKPLPDVELSEMKSRQDDRMDRMGIVRGDILFILFILSKQHWLAQ
jgi:hypothetical protein